MCVCVCDDNIQPVSQQTGRLASYLQLLLKLFLLDLLSDEQLSRIIVAAVDGVHAFVGLCELQCVCVCVCVCVCACVRV